MESALLDTLVKYWNEESPISSENVLEKIKKRAKSKYLTNKYIFKLITLHSALDKGYWNTYYCNQVLVQEGKKIYGHYCGNRWCFECNRIRTAKLINGYKPVVSTFKDPWYIVLTVKNVDCEVLTLRSKVKEMNKEFRKIVDLIRKRDQIYIEAIRTIEVTYNKNTNKLHPHFNLVINGKVNAEMIITEWLKHFPENEVNRGGQCMERADINTLNELFKYVVKFDDKTPGKALDTIFQALKGIMITSPTGIKKIKEEIENLVITEISELVPAERSWWWSQKEKDWITKNCWPDESNIKLCKFIKQSIKINRPLKL